MDFYGRAVLVITKFTALQETCSKSSFYYWIWFSRKNRKKAKKNIKGNQLSAFVRFLKNSIVVCFFDRNFWGVIEVSAIFQGLLKNSNATWFLQSEFLSIFKRILQYPFDKNMEFEFFFGPNDFIWGAMKVPFSDFIQKMSQAPSSSVQVLITKDKLDYLRNPSVDFKKYFCFGLLWIPSNAERQN